jgi:hypothetical protein
MSKPSKPKKLRVSIELDPELADAFEEIVQQVSAACNEPKCSAPIAAGLLSMGIARHRQDPELGLALLQNRLSQFKTRKPSIRTAAPKLLFPKDS